MIFYCSIFNLLDFFEAVKDSIRWWLDEILFRKRLHIFLGLYKLPRKKCLQLTKVVG